MRSQLFSRQPMDKILRQLCDQQRSYTGTITIETGNDTYYLFFFNSAPYAAGKIVDERPISLSIRDFFSEIGDYTDKNATITIYSCDPVLLKCMLIYIEDYPTAKAPTNMMNLNAVVEQIQKDPTDTLVILEREQKLNFFFFRHNTRGLSYYSDTEFVPPKGRTILDELMAYSLQPGAEINAMIYRSTDTRSDMDYNRLSQTDMLQLLDGADKGSLDLATENEPTVDNLVISILEGIQANQVLSSSIPCTLGRKDADIIINDSLMSKQHISIQALNGKIMLMDLHSTNGTFLNGVRIKEHLLTEGDILLVGGTKLKIDRLAYPA